MDRKSLSVYLCLAVIGGVGVYFYESQLIELRGELEEARLREAQAAAALTRLSELRRAEAQARRSAEAAPALPPKPVADPPPNRTKIAASRKSTAAAEADSMARRQAEEVRRVEAEAKAAAERARQDAEARANAEPRFYREPFRPGESSSARAPREHLEDAQALEREGKGADAVRIYIRAARGGSGPAAQRLYEIYMVGIAGVMPSYAEALKWRNAARVLGEEVSKPPDAPRAEEEARRAAEEARRAAEAAKREAEKAGAIPSHQALYQHGQALEQEGRTEDAVRVYVRAVRAGSADAARRLGEIVDEGKAPRNLPHPDLVPTVPRAQAQD